MAADAPNHIQPKPQRVHDFWHQTHPVTSMGQVGSFFLLFIILKYKINYMYTSSEQRDLKLEPIIVKIFYKPY